MICKNCKKEISDGFEICPNCGKRCGSDDFFQEMISHVMDDNTQSSKEMDKLKESMKNRTKNRKRNRIIAVICIVGALVIALCIGAIAFHFATLNADHGENTYRAGFDGTTFSVYDDEGREVRTISGSTYSEKTYGSDDRAVFSAVYNGFVSFERNIFENGLVKTNYLFDGTSSYVYKDFTYTLNDEGLPSRASYSSKYGENTGIYDYVYNEQGLLTSVYKYVFESRSAQNFEYDSTGRKTGEQKFTSDGSLMYDKQYSYKSDGTLYLSSVNEVHKTDPTGKPLSYRLTNYAEDGKAKDGVINTPDGKLSGMVEYSYGDNGKIASIKYFGTDSVQTGWELYDYYEDGSVKKYATKDNGVEETLWYRYTYHENGALATCEALPSENSGDFISYKAYDAEGREIRSKTSGENLKKSYSNGFLTEVITYSAEDEPIKKTAYSYNEDGNCVLQTDTSPDGTVIATRSYAYDGMGKVINEAGGEADYLYINEYDDYYNLTAVSTYRLASSELTEYDSNGRVIKKTADNISEGFEYGEDGKAASKYIYGSDGKAVSRVDFVYNKKGDQTGLLHYGADGEKTGRSEISYDDRLKVITLKSYDKNDELYYTLKYNYSIDAPSIEISGTNRFENKTDEYIYTYSFDKNGRLAEVLYSKNKEKASQFLYAYNDVGDVISGEAVSFAPEQSSTKYEYTYKNGLLSSVSITAPDGKVTTTAYALDENKRPYMKTGDK